MGHGLFLHVQIIFSTYFCLKEDEFSFENARIHDLMIHHCQTTFLHFLMILVNLFPNVNYFYPNDGQSYYDYDHGDLRVLIDENQTDTLEDDSFFFI